MGCSMKQFALRTFAGFCLIAASTAVARSLSVDVVRFHTGLAPAGQTITLQPADPALAASLEFSSYANQIGAGLEKLGFKPAVAGTKADLVGTISYGQTERADTSRSGPAFSIGVGVGTFGGNGGVSVGGSVPIGGGQSTTKMIRTTTLVLTLKRANDTVAAWEGRATTEGKSDAETALPAVIPALTEALLTDFPGVSGKTARLKIKSPTKR